MSALRRSTSLARQLPIALFVLVAFAAGAQASVGNPPSVSAPEASVLEASTGTVLYSKNGNRRAAEGSTTKLMTALVALNRDRLGKVMTAINYQAGAAETTLGLIPGEKIKFADLLRAMMLPSANDAAMTVGVRSGGTESAFVGLMNAQAQRWGLTNTHFTNPIGLDSPSHYTSAIDLARIGIRARANPFLQTVMTKHVLTLKSGAMPRTIVNRNRILGDLGGTVDGIKTGHTSGAGYCLVSSATKNGVTVVSVVLGTGSEDARDADSLALLKWGEAQDTQRTLVAVSRPVATLPVSTGKQTSVAVVSDRTVKYAVPVGAKVLVHPVGLPASLDAPVKQGQVVGAADLLVNGKRVDRVKLVAATSVERLGTIAALTNGLPGSGIGLLIGLALLLVGTLAIARGMRRRATDRRAAQRRTPRESVTR